jgi:hypothetical protein
MKTRRFVLCSSIGTVRTTIRVLLARCCSRGIEIQVLFFIDHEMKRCHCVCYSGINTKAHAAHVLAAPSGWYKYSNPSLFSHGP